jgi:alkylation response protein AidB-like acyl-CoA dehydrogenase
MIVDLEPTEDQTLIVESVAGLLADRLPVSRLREATARGGATERAIWDDLAGLGLFGLGLPDEKGGIGYGLPEEVLVARALGMHLVSLGVLAQMVAAHLATDAQRDAVTSGATRAAFATTTLSGALHRIDGEGATLVVVVGPGGVALASADEFEWQPMSAMDETITLDIATTTSVSPQASPGAQRVALLLAAYQAGVGQAATDMAVDYAKTREQFGQPIGAFQAIKHMCADMAVRAAAADAQTRYAAVTLGQGNDDDREIAAARLLASDAALANAKANVQIHGGMGFTAECDAHLFLKRAHLLASLGSSRRAEERRLMADAG